MTRLISYLRENIIVDFQGDLSLEKVRELLAGDDSRDAKAVLTRLSRDRKVDDMLLVLADCLLETVQAALTDDVVRGQLQTYADS